MPLHPSMKDGEEWNPEDSSQPHSGSNTALTGRNALFDRFFFFLEKKKTPVDGSGGP